MAPKSVKNSVTSRRPAAALASFICVCGDIVLDRDRSKHACGGSGQQTGLKRTTGKATAMSSGAVGDKDDNKEKDAKVTLVKSQRPLVGTLTAEELSKMKKLATLNWSLKFGRRGQLVIELVRKGKSSGMETTVVADVIDDEKNLPIHTYRFQMGSDHYSFEFFM